MEANCDKKFCCTIYLNDHGYQKSQSNQQGIINTTKVPFHHGTNSTEEEALHDTDMDSSDDQK